ncbi:hypothetical protein [uncultured Muriicola sp.]|uniref:hypothetical protein n=1 Tax=uncultured Muriicola sp. TaxID=1583102 RepID=UPI002611FFA9|nr:hypothetical protein [uncultured Muriicola sp.]
MKLAVKLFGILMLLLGISLLIKPEIIISWIENNMENTSLYITAIVVRLVFGILFIVAANESRYTGVIKFFGYLFILAAIILIFIGQENFKHFISSLIPEVVPFAPLSGLLAIAFGGFLIYAFTRNKELEQK